MIGTSIKELFLKSDLLAENWIKNRVWKILGRSTIIDFEQYSQIILPSTVINYITFSKSAGGGEKTFTCCKYLLVVLEENGSSLFIIIGIILKANLIIKHWNHLQFSKILIQLTCQRPRSTEPIKIDNKEINHSGTLIEVQLTATIAFIWHLLSMKPAKFCEGLRVTRK